MKIETVDQLMVRLAELFPMTFPDTKRFSAWEPQYQTTLGHLDADQLDAAWKGCIAKWTKKNSAPLPADILKAHTAVYSVLQGSHPPMGSAGSFAEYLRKRDADLSKDRQAIIAAWMQNHPKIAALAMEEGWILALRTQLVISANMLVQRDRKRADGGNPGMSHEDRAYYCLEDDNGAEVIAIGREKIEIWRSHAQSKTNAMPDRSSTFRQAGAAA